MTIQEKAVKIAELTNTMNVIDRHMKWGEEISEAKWEFRHDGVQLLFDRERAIAEIADVVITSYSLAQALGCNDLDAVIHAKTDKVLEGLQNE